jgi:hypothetical protein
MSHSVRDARPQQRACLAQGLRVFYVMNLMTIGLYSEPRGAFLASVSY